jgi:Fe-S cluster assembly protein SufD
MSTVAADAMARYGALLDAQRRERAEDYPQWLSTLSDQAATRLATQGFPDQRSEAWRYTNLARLLEQPFEPARYNAALTKSDAEDFIIPGLESLRIVLVNGQFAPLLSELSDAPRGLRVTGLAEALRLGAAHLEGFFEQLEPSQCQVFADLNLAALTDGIVLRLEPGVRVERPIELLHVAVGAAGPQVAQPRHLFALGKASSATLVERYVSLGADLYFNNVAVNIHLEDEAVLEHQVLQEESRNAFHIHSQFLRQGDGSRYRGLGLALGGAWSRADWQAALLGNGAEHRIGGLYVVGDGQLTDNHLDIRHEGPACVSREDFRGVLNGKGRGVFDGRILVQKGAQKTDAQLSNRNLMLSRQAEIDTKPQLEIYADDVACSHGTTVGEMDADALFYLRSRGMDRQRAQQMISLGFAREVFQDCQVAGLSGYIEEVVGERLTVEAAV